MDAESVRLTLGTFLTSPGFGGLAAVIAAVFAARSVGKRLAGDRELAKQQREHEVEMATTADSRQRWWEVLFWLDTGLLHDRVTGWVTQPEWLAWS